MNRKEKLTQLIEKYKQAKINGDLNQASEETVRTWINQLLAIFGWDVSNTHQVIQERILKKEERQKLSEIGSTYIKPDYTLMNGTSRLFFLDAKNFSIKVKTNQENAFQIRSYGWSIGAPYSIISNFEELAIYDCAPTPHHFDSPATARIHYLTYDKYIQCFDTLENYLCREKVIEVFSKEKFRGNNNLDTDFAKFLCEIRLDMASDILKRNNIEINVQELNLWTQIIINRILFIRVCEARNLEDEGLLLKFLEQGFWNEFKKSSYIDFYEHYDGPLFDRLEILQQIEIGNEVFAKLLSNLYYPSPYCFDVIPLKSISDIYEIFLGYHLEKNDNRLKIVLKSEFKKSNGAVTTPIDLVNQTISLVLNKKDLKSLSVKEILSLSFLDPACGSGIFLLAIFDILVEAIEYLIIKNPDSLNHKYYTTISGEPKLNIEGKKLVATNCLYGIDICQESVEVSKLSLSLKIIDGFNPINYTDVGIFGHKILNGVGNNVKCGNTLVSSDILSICPNIIENIEEYERTNVFDWNNAFPMIYNRGGFDYVIGNPPYVEVKNYVEGLPSMHDYIKRRYESSRNGKIDLSIPFIERGLELLNAKGSLGFLVQKRFYRAQYGKGIRKYISNHGYLSKIKDFDETNLFTNHITYISILVCDKSISNIDTFQFISDNGDVSYLSKKLVTDSPWNFEDARGYQLLHEKTLNLGTLGDYCKIRVGLQALWYKAYHIKVTKIDDKYIYGHSVIDDSVKIEKSACRVLICNEKFMSLSVRPHSTYILFPYSIIQGRANKLSFSDYKRSFPLAAEYLLKHKAEIKANVQTFNKKGYNPDEYWHLFTRDQSQTDTYPKICVPMTAKEPQAAVIKEENIYTDNANVFFIRLPKITKDYLYAVSAFINSTPFSYFAKIKANPQQNGFYKFNKQFLNPLPFPVKAFNSFTPEIQNLAEIAIKIEEIQLKIQQSPSKEARYKSALMLLWNQLDEICCTLYNFSQEEKDLVMSKPRNDR